MTPDRTEVITIRGIVQGVGFRPTVWRIASRLGMRGRVRNMGGFVQIVVTDTPARIDAFVAEIRAGRPRMARIDRVDREAIETALFSDFRIAESTRVEDEIAVIPADIAVCDDCLREYFSAGDARHGYGYISCTNCGPRYTIMERLPYDRDTTTMGDFPMCTLCASEYGDPATRRYHAQTVSCHDCGPQPLWKANPHFSGPGSAAAAAAAGKGGVFGLKGVGGYYLVCDATDEGAVSLLREIKRREQKPFAVMFESVEDVRRYCRVGAAEEAELLSPRRPIVLLEQRPVLDEGIPALAAGVCRHSRFIGAFLPSFALQIELLRRCGAPLVMTSANLSELPILTEDAGMFALMEERDGIAGVLYHERRIAAGLDDSVVRVIDGTAQILRRAKGYVPAPVYLQGVADAVSKHDMVFASGGHLKAAFALSKGAFAYLSRHLGDMDTLASESLFEETFARMKAFFAIKPGRVACDLHPRYFPTQFAERYAAAHGLPVLHVQHHHAHIASVMAEHGLTGPVIGVAFDGTGYGTDGTVWGGEVLVCEGGGFERFSHLACAAMLGGDESMRDAWKAAVAYRGGGAPGASAPSGPSDTSRAPAAEFHINLEEILAFCERNAVAERQWGAAETDAVFRAIAAGVNTVRSSSMGRLFDAAAAMLGICPVNAYEGQCASMLENAAERALHGSAEEPDRLALLFHERVAAAILSQCRLARGAHGIGQVCLSGGVFQNKILMEEALRLLRGDAFEVFYNVHVPPNDGGIAVGQCYLALMR
jgi:hydrogenase maturation protein HypF